MFGRKMLAALCLVFFASIATAAQVYARPIDSTVHGNNFVEIEPIWANVAMIMVDLRIDNGRANLSGFVLGNHGTTSISVNAVLERINPNGTLTHIVAFNNIRVNGDIWDWERPHYVARGHTYLLTLTATVVRNGVSEVVSLSRTAWAN